MQESFSRDEAYFVALFVLQEQNEIYDLMLALTESAVGITQYCFNSRRAGPRGLFTGGGGGGGEGGGGALEAESLKRAA